MPRFTSTMNKNSHKLVKYVSPSNKPLTGVWFAGYKSLYLLFVSFNLIHGVVNGLEKTRYNYAKIMQPVRMTYKIAPTDAHIPGLGKERVRILSVQIISKIRKKMV